MKKTISPNQFITKAPDWKTFFQSLSELNETSKVRGDIFDRLTQLYLQASPIYIMKFKNVWLIRQVPPRVRKLLNLPDYDFGIDQIAETFDGEYWSIQSKFRSDTDSALSYGELSTFSTLSFVKLNLNPLSSKRPKSLWFGKISKFSFLILNVPLKKFLSFLLYLRSIKDLMISSIAPWSF